VELLSLGWTTKGNLHAWLSHLNFISKCQYVVILAVFLRLVLCLEQKIPLLIGICASLQVLMLKWRLRNIILRYIWQNEIFGCLHLKLSGSKSDLLMLCVFWQVMDVVDKLFVAMFDILNTKCKKDLEAVANQYPFEPLKVYICMGFVIYYTICFIFVNLFVM